MSDKFNLLEFKNFNQDTAIFIENQINSLLKTKSNINVAFSGGNTPLPILEILKASKINWEKISFFLETLDLLKVYDKEIYIIDTFEGMTEPLSNDYQVVSNSVMKKGEMSVTIEDVKKNIYMSNYPKDKLHFIKMDVRDKKILNDNIKDDIAILRLDTDFYDSTLSILDALYFRVKKIND